MSELIIGTRAVAKELNVTTQTIYRWTEKGMPYTQLKNGKRGYVLADIQAWLMSSDK